MVPVPLKPPIRASTVARPDTRVFLPSAFNAEKAGALALRPAQAATQVAARRTATQILMTRVTLSGARPLAAESLQLAGRASAAVGGALSRTPVVGTVIRRLAPFVPKGPGFGVTLALNVVPSIFEYFAPTVKGWLTGGWRGPSYGSIQPASSGPWFPAVAGVSYTVREMVTDYTGETYMRQEFGPFPSIEFWRYSVEGDDWIRHTNFPFGYHMAPDQGVETRFRANNCFAQFFRNGSPVEGPSSTGSSTGTITKPDIVTQNPKPTAPSQTQTNNAANAQNAALLAALATIAAGKYKPAPTVNRNPTQNPARKVGLLPSASPTTPPPSSQPCKGNSCGQAGLDQAKKNGEDLQKILDALSLLGIGDIKKTVDRIDQKVGPQLYDDRGNKIGLAGHAIKMFEKINKVGDYLHFDRITNVMTLAVTVHNAAMLSNQLEQTLMSAISNGLAAIGIKDSDNNPLDVNKIVGQSVENMVKGAIGAENYAALTINWKKANRIYQASANLLNNLQSLRYSITGALETIGGMNAKVGNALKKYGVLGDNAYPWFNPSPNYDNKFMRGIEVAETTVSSIDSVASEILSAQDSVKQIGEQKTELEKAIKEGTEKPGVDNTQQKEKAAAAKTASKSPDVNPEDLVKPGGI
jgi:hypothetical protein